MPHSSRLPEEVPLSIPRGGSRNLRKGGGAKIMDDIIKYPKLEFFMKINMKIFRKSGDAPPPPRLLDPPWNAP